MLNARIDGVFFFFLLISFFSEHLLFVTVSFAFFPSFIKYGRFVSQRPKFIVPDWGDKIDYDIVLSYRTVGLHRLVGRTTTICHIRL